MLNRILQDLGLLVLGCIALGWVAGNMDSEPLSYIVCILGGLFMWYLLFRKYL